MSDLIVAVIDVCSQEGQHEPHLRQPLWPRRDGQPHDPRWLWCLGHYDQNRQGRRVVVEREGTERLVGEGLTLVGSAYRQQREPGECEECCEPEDFDWDPIRWEDGAPVIVCHKHAMLAPGWAYSGDIEVGLRAWENEPLMKPKIKYVGSRPEYELVLNGEVIGRVEAYEQHYNLRRAYTARGWTARSADGQHVASSDYTDSRRSAVLALLSAMGIEGVIA